MVHMGSPSKAPEHPLHEELGEGSLGEGSGIASNPSSTLFSLNITGGACGLPRSGTGSFHWGTQDLGMRGELHFKPH